MGKKFIVIQPNGLYAIYSSFIDTFAEYNLSKDDLLKLCSSYFPDKHFGTAILPSGPVIKANCTGQNIYDMSDDIIPVMNLADAITHVLANNETTATIQKKLKEMGYKYWDRVVLGSGDTSEDVDCLLKRINIDIAKILYHYNVSLEVVDGKIVVRDRIFVDSDKDRRFEPVELKPDFENAQKENFYYTD